MPSSYYTHASGKPANQTRGLASEVRYELDSIAASFALLPSPTALASGSINYALDTGLTNAYVVSVSSAVTAYSDGFSFFFKPLNNNSGASTLNVNTLGLKAIVRPDGTAVQLNDIVANQILKLTYNSSYNGFQLDTDISYANQAAASASAAAASAGSAAASAAATAGAIVAERSASRALTNLTGITLVSGGASITGNSSVTGQLTTTDNVGIGRPTNANYRAIIRGIGTTSATNTLVLENSSGTETVIADDAGNFGIGRPTNANYRAIIRGIGTTSATNTLVLENSSGTETVIVDDAGNAGLGVTPSAWISAYRVIDVGTSLSLQGRTDSTIDNSFASNGYRNSGGAWIYKTTNQAFHYSHNANGHVFERAVSGTAGGTISWITDALIDTSGNLLPGANGTQAFGSTSLRWSQVWCTAGAFNTSDATLKTPLRAMQAQELAAGFQMSQELGTFQWLDSVKEKGDKARRHVGLTVQRAAEIMESHGLKPWSYGFMGFDKWEAVTEIVDATEADYGAYQEQVTRQKTKKQTNQQNAVEIINGKPTLKVETVESDVPVTEQIQVVDADGKPVFIDVPEVPAVLDEEGHVVTPAVPAHQVPMLHAVPVRETVTVWKRVKEVRPAGESYAFRSDQLAFFIAAGVAAKVGA